MDGDVFGKVTKLGRATADAVARALDGGEWDPFHALRCLDVLVASAGGVPSLKVIAEEISALADAPLFARFQCESAARRIREASCGRGCTELDMILRSSAERAVFRGELNVENVLQRFCGQLLDRAALTGRGGFLEEHGHKRLAEAREILTPAALAAASVLFKRPTAKNLGLAREHADIRPDTDLLGGL